MVGIGIRDMNVCCWKLSLGINEVTLGDCVWCPSTWSKGLNSIYIESDHVEFLGYSKYPDVYTSLNGIGKIAEKKK